MERTCLRCLVIALVGATALQAAALALATRPELVVPLLDVLRAALQALGGVPFSGL